MDDDNVLDIGLAWHRRLQRTGSEPDAPIIANTYNATVALIHAPEWRDVLAYNSFTGTPMALQAPPRWLNPAYPNPLHPDVQAFLDRRGLNQATPIPLPPDNAIYPRPWTDSDDNNTMLWMQANRINVGPDMTRQALKGVVDQRCYHPVRGWLRYLEWDHVPRISEWLIRYLGADDTPLNRAIGTRFLIGMVARVMEPGCQLDTVLVLQGQQGTYKSQALRALASPEWYSSYISKLTHKDAMSDLRGVWLMELAEFEALKHVSIETAKRFITTQIDKFRPTWGRHSVTRPRETVLAATTNEVEFLTDVSGGRRFWVVETGRILLDALYEARDQLFAEAVVYYDADFAWHMDTEELEAMAAAVQDAHTEQDAWQESIEVFLFGRDSVTVDDIFKLKLDRKDMNTWTKADRNRIANILRSLGFRRRYARTGVGPREYRWFRRP